MGLYQSVPREVEAEQYDGTTDSLKRIRLLLTRQLPQDQTVIIGHRTPWVRHLPCDEQPDQLLIVGSWIVLGPDKWITHSSNAAFTRHYESKEEQE